MSKHLKAREARLAALAAHPMFGPPAPPPSDGERIAVSEAALSEGRRRALDGLFGPAIPQDLPISEAVALEAVDPLPSPGGAWTALWEADDGGFDDERREVVGTLLQVGRGNQRDGNYYTLEALEAVARAVMERPKVYVVHSERDRRGQVPVRGSRPIGDWVATIKETWIEEGQRLKARIRVVSRRLWDRIKADPGQIGFSIEGRGRGERGTAPDGRPANLIKDVAILNGFAVVDYPGAAPMGVSPAVA